MIAEWIRRTHCCTMAVNFSELANKEQTQKQQG